ncbi:MAG: replication-associated recombination protein A [Pseudomonadota bacterium]
MDLFEAAAERDQVHAPLAERMRPRTLDEVVGQDALLAPGKPLRRAIDQGRLPSMILWGPPGVGKTTLARLLARHMQGQFVGQSAVQCGVKEIREIVEQARRLQVERRQRTLLFLDEIHRFNKAQQDALLPHVERGTVTLVGATTENPSFEVNAALLSRCRVYVLQSLDEDGLIAILRRALLDAGQGLGALGIAPDDQALRTLAAASWGDARRALLALELACEDAADRGEKALSVEGVERVLAEKVLLYDKAGEEHYNIVSAFIKSLRGSDPDAAAYYLARMLEAGEDPRFVIRRMVIFASEDVGNADPGALALAVATLQAYEFVGLPEAVLPLTQCATYLALAPKSNSALTTYAAARHAVRERGPLPVPLHIRNAPTDLMKKLGYGGGYKYPHDFDGHYVAERYLPEAIAGERIFQPGPSPREQEMQRRLETLRRSEAQRGDTEAAEKKTPTS